MQYPAISVLLPTIRSAAEDDDDDVGDPLVCHTNKEGENRDGWLSVRLVSELSCSQRYFCNSVVSAKRVPLACNCTHFDGTLMI